MTTHAQSHAHHKTVVAAATADIHDHPHETTALPEVLDLTAAQKTLVSSLHFLSQYEIAHTPKVSPDIFAALDETTLATIENNGELGGKDRGKRIREARARHEQLIAIANVVGPIARVVGQALMRTDADLAREAGEPLKVAHALARTKPGLLEGLGAIDRWTRTHHKGGHASAIAAPTAPVARP